MYRKDELIHMGVKGMKWRKGRKTPITDTVTNLHDARQKQIDAKRNKATNAFNKGLANAKNKATVEKGKKSVKSGMKSGLDSPGGMSREYFEELKANSQKNKYPEGFHTESGNDTTKSKLRSTSKEIVKGAKPPVTWKQHTKKKSKLS